jgi:hypothetical protein
MNTSIIIAQIDAEITRLQQAKALLTGVATKKSPGRPKAAKAVTMTTATKPVKRIISTEAKARMAAAQKKRWAKVKRAAKKAAKATELAAA